MRACPACSDPRRGVNREEAVAGLTMAGVNTWAERNLGIILIGIIALIFLKK